MSNHRLKQQTEFKSAEVMETLSSSYEEHYKLSYIAFKNSTLGDLPKIVGQNIPFVVKEIIQKRKKEETKPFNILSIGSGNGFMDILLVKLVQKELKTADYKDAKIFIRALEPCTNSIKDYKENLQKTPELLKEGCTFDIKAMSFEDYVVNEKTSVRYDLVVLIHSIYYLDVEKSLQHCFYNELKGHGKIAVVCEEGGPSTYITKFTNGEVGEKYCPPKTTKTVAKNGWKTIECRNEMKIRVSEIFEEHNPNGNLLLDFFTHIVNFRVNATKIMVDKVMEILDRYSKMENGQKYVDKVDILYVISK